MPRESVSLIRASGFREAKKRFILAFEGEVTEPRYFKNFIASDYFNAEGIMEIIILKREKNTGTDPFSVKRLLKKAKENSSFRRSDEYWLIIDRDHWETTHKLSFSQLYQECESEGNFFVAMSNPCFEIWLLLHLQDVAKLSEEVRAEILINKKISSSKTFIDNVLSNLLEHGYNKGNPPCDAFFPQITIAIERGKALDVPLRRHPIQIGSHIYKLMEKLYNCDLQ